MNNCFPRPQWSLVGSHAFFYIHGAAVNVSTHRQAHQTTHGNNNNTSFQYSLMRREPNDYSGEGSEAYEGGGSDRCEGYSQHQAGGPE